MTFLDREALQSLREFVEKLETKPPCDVERGTFEVKGWCRTERELWKLVVDAVVCLANAEGGAVLVGPDDGQRIQLTRPCPHPGVSPEWLREQIRKFSHPPVECSAHRLKDLYSSLPGTAGQALVVLVPRKRIMGVHTTHAGVCLIRHQDNCEIDHLASADDYSAIVVERASLESLSPKSLQWAFGNTAVRPRTHLKWRQSRRSVDDLLSDFNLIYPGDGRTFAVTLAAILLFGKDEALAQLDEGTFLRITVRQGNSVTGMPYTLLLRQNIVDTLRDIWTREGGPWFLREERKRHRHRVRGVSSVRI